MKTNPNYYAILIAEVRYAKNLTNLQKLLYAEMTALSEKEGFCWASNSYFAKLYDKHETYISQVITDMNKKGYIDVFVSSKDGNTRKIYIGGIQKNLKTSLEKPKDPSLEKPKDNNTSINTKINEDVSYETPPPDTYKTKQKIYQQRGLTYKPKEKTEKQKRLFVSDGIIKKFRECAAKKGFDLLSKENKERNKRISGQIQTMLIQGRDLDEIVEWWFFEKNKKGEFNGEWCDYSPENLFCDRTFESFKNNKNKNEGKPKGLKLHDGRYLVNGEIVEA